MNDKTNLVIDLSWMDDCVYAIQESFEISYFRIVDGVIEVFIDNPKPLISFLDEHKIKNIVQTDYVKIYINADIYIQPNHHIELRGRKKQ